MKAFHQRLMLEPEGELTRIAREKPPAAAVVGAAVPGMAGLTADMASTAWSMKLVPRTSTLNHFLQQVYDDGREQLEFTDSAADERPGSPLTLQAVAAAARDSWQQIVTMMKDKDQEKLSLAQRDVHVVLNLVPVAGQATEVFVLESDTSGTSVAIVPVAAVPETARTGQVMRAVLPYAVFSATGMPVNEWSCEHGVQLKASSWVSVICEVLKHVSVATAVPPLIAKYDILCLPRPVQYIHTSVPCPLALSSPIDLRLLSEVSTLFHAGGPEPKRRKLA